MKENWEIHWKDYYGILQIHPLAEPEVVKAAYRKLAQKYYPDLNKEPTAPSRMKDLNEAFEVIDNPEKRGRYYVAYCQRVNPKPIITPPPGSESTKTNRNASPPNTSSTSQPPPRPQPKPKATPNRNPKNELTLNEQLKLLLIIAAQDKNIYFRKKEWIKNINEVKNWFDNFRGGATGLGVCPYCKEKYVLENLDASIRKCVNPNCDYVLTPEYNWANKSKAEYTTRTSTTAKTRTNSHPHAKEGLGNLHAKGKYTPDNSNLNPNIAKPISNDPITIILIIIALCITMASWYPYIMSHNRWWLFLCIPISIVCLPAAIIWILGLKESKPHNKSS